MPRPLIPLTILLLACQASPPKPAEQAETAPAAPEPGSSQWKIHDAISAAPAAIAAAAAVMDWPAAAGGTMTELRPGTNGWTCMPDNPATPGSDPMCLDANALKWAAAWAARTKPQLDAIGMGYMLVGGSDASNTDPYATGPAPGNQWVETGPHVMLFPTDPVQIGTVPVDYTTGGPYVMWQGTPYAHVMMPVR